MKRALLLGGAVPGSVCSAGTMKQVLEGIWDGLFAIDIEEDYSGLTEARLHGFDLVVHCGRAWEGNKAAAGNLAAYTACGGNYLAIHRGLFHGELFELDCLAGARILGEGHPCLLEFMPAEKSHPITSSFAPFSVTEEPLFPMLDPLLSPQVLMEISYAAVKIPAAWCHTYGWGKVVCVTPGRQAESFLPFLSKLIYRSGLWFLNRI